MKRFSDVRKWQSVAVGLLLTLAGCGQQAEDQSQQKSSSVEDIPRGTYVDSVVIELAGIDSQTVFDLLKDGHEVAYKSSAMGVFVTAIDSIENSASAYWIYSVNDSVPQVACDKYVTKSGDVVKWHFQEMRE